MFRCAVFLTDLGEGCGRVISLGRDVRALGVTDAVLVHLVDIFGRTDGGRLRSPSRDDLFTEQLEALERLGLRVRVDVPVGHVTYSVEEVASRHDADIIVVGGRSLGLFESAHSGGVSADLARISARPVLLGPSHPDEVPLLDRVLFPTDFSETAAMARQVLERSVAAGVRSVHLLHVQDMARLAGTPTSDMREFDARDTVRLEKWKRRLLARGAEEVTTEIVHGHPVEVVSAAAADGGFSLIVMGRRGRSPGPERLLGSVSDAVIKVATCPVLLAPQRFDT